MPASASAKFYGVTVSKTPRAGTRYRVLVPVNGRGNVYGGTFTDAREAAQKADCIRYWLHRTGVVPRPPRLNFPREWEGEADRLPVCPDNVAELAKEMTEEDKQKLSVGASFSELQLTVARLAARVEALEKQLAAANNVCGPKPF